MNIPQLELFKIKGLTQSQSNATYYFAAILIVLAVIMYVLDNIILSAGSIVVLKLFGEWQIKKWRALNNTKAVKT